MCISEAQLSYSFRYFYITKMLSIVPDVSEDDISSDSSECTDSSKRILNKRVKVKDSKTETTAARDDGSSTSRQVFSPGDLADCSTTDGVESKPTAVLKDLTRSWPQEKLQRFADLQEKRVQAAEEKVAEGFRRRRRRKRRNQGSKQDESHDGDLSKKSCDDPQKRHSAETDHSAQRPSEMKEDGPSPSSQERWDTLKGYLNVNSHISQGVDHGQYAPKSGLEKRLDEAVAEGDFDQAEKLSEELSVRDLGCKIAKAADARDYMKWKTEREEEKAAKKRKKKKKLAWGFEVKNRWEMKANM